MIIKNVLLAEDAGLGNGETPIFPIHIFKVKEGINYNPGDPNYDMFQLACKVSAKRLFPNFEFIDAPFNLQYYKEGDPDTEVATMGCVLGRETVKWRYKHTVGQVFHTSFTQFWNEVLKVSVPQLYGDSEYIVTTNLVEIYDSMHNGFVDCLKIIKRNSHNDWVKLKFGNGNTLICTTDHPLPVYNKDTETYTRTFVKDIAVGDCIPVAGSNDPMYKYVNNVTTSIVSITPMGPSSAPSYDVETSSDMFDVSGIVSHNCRTRVMGNVHDPDKQIVTGRGNLSFTSINLPRLAIEAKGDIDKFYKSLDDMVNLVIDQLKHRFKIQCAKRVENFPFLMGQGVWLDSENLDSMDSVEEVLKHGSLSVGFIGLAETLKCLIGVHHGESMKAQELGIEIVTRMRHRLDEEAQKTKLNFTLLATPAEGLCLAGDTLVQTPYGNKPIKDIKAGDEVLSFNLDTHQVEIDIVAKSWMTSPNRKVMKITFDTGQELICTPNHPIGKIVDGDVNFTEADKINIGDKIKSHYTDESTVYPKSSTDADHVVTKIEYLDEGIPVYDLTMTNNSNFFVGGDRGILVHNSGRFVRMDAKKYGIIEGVTDRDYYTNSFHQWWLDTRVSRKSV